MRELIAEDEEQMSRVLSTAISHQGYVVDVAYDGQTAIDLANQNAYDVMVMDVMMPVKTGVEAVKEIRQSGNKSHIIMLTAMAEIDDRVTGLDAGADDYLTKPFSPREVLARMKAIFRRLKPTTTETLQEDTPKAPLVIGEIRVDEQNYEVFVRNQPIELTPKEFELLVYFMKRKDRVINRETLLERIWQYDFAGQSRIVDVHISHLRDKIEPDPKRPVYLVTVRGFGYRFQEPKR